MIDKTTMGHILDSLKNPVAFTDMDHKIVYLNKVATARYEQGEKLLGTSIFDCHNEKSNKIIVEVFEEMKKGLDERMIIDDEEYRVYMRAVRDGDGALIGYYERYEPPVKKAST
jgi:transcriptional regulator with PAS, ATPase and Fis domain